MAPTSAVVDGGRIVGVDTVAHLIDAESKAGSDLETGRQCLGHSRCYHVSSPGVGHDLNQCQMTSGMCGLRKWLRSSAWRDRVELRRNRDGNTEFSSGKGRKFMRVRDAFLLKLGRTRIKGPGTRWTSVPNQLGHADPVLMTDFRRRNSDIGAAHDVVDILSGELHSSTSDASLESSRTFRYCSANSYEDFLRTGTAGAECGVRKSDRNRRGSDMLAQMRSYSEVTLACGEQVVSKLQMLKQRSVKQNCDKVAPAHQNSLSRRMEPVNDNYKTSDTLRKKNKNQTIEPRLKVLPEELCTTESRVNDGEFFCDNFATSATIDDCVASLSLPMSVLSDSLSDSEAAFPHSSNQPVLPKSSPQCQPPVKPPRRYRQVSERVSADSQKQVTDSKPLPTAQTPYSPPFSHVRQERSSSSVISASRNTASPFSDADLTGQSPLPPPRCSARRRISTQQATTSPSLDRSVHETRSPCVQDVDNGFFENFAGLPQRQRHLQQTTRQKRPSMRCSGDETHQRNKNSCSSPFDAVIPLATISNSSTASSQKLAEEVFVSALYTLQHPIGCDSPSAEQVEEAQQLLQQIFQPSMQQLDTFRKLAQNRGSPRLSLECSVIGANGLTAADPNGLSDPFCVVRLNDTECRETPVCSKTLNPVWNQKYVLSLSNPDSDEVHFEVFDFDEEENLAQRLGKISDIKGVKGFTRYVKDVAKKGRHNFLGQVKVKIKDLPALGVETFFKLQTHRRDPDVKEKTGMSPLKDRGRLRLRLRLLTRQQSSPDQQFSDRQLEQQHGKLLVSVLTAERQLAAAEAARAEAGVVRTGAEGGGITGGGGVGGENFTWSAHQMRECSRRLIDQHAAHCNLDQAVIALTRWISYTQVHCATPMNYTFLYTSLQTVRVFLQSNALNKEQKGVLIASLIQFVDQCYETIRIHRHLYNSDVTSHVQNMESMLRCLLIVSEMATMLDDGVKRPSAEQIQKGVKAPNMDKLSNPRRYIASALLHGNDDWYRQVYKSARNEASDDGEAQDTRCRCLILLINMLYTDVEAALDTYDKIFKRNMGVNYFASAYIQFAERLKQEVGPIVEELSRSLPSVEFDVNQIGRDLSQQGLDMGTALFELYMALQMFTSLSSHLPVEEGKMSASNPLQESHTWFSDAVNRWLEIACFKAMHRIKKAIELDQATEIDSNVYRSSSAVDAVAVFYQIRTFWNQLNWPDPIGSYSFIIKVLDDIIRTADFYVRQMHVSLRANHFHCRHHPFQFTRELCLSINSAEFVRQHISRLPSDLGFELIFTSLEEQFCSESTVSCRATLQNIVDQASEDVELSIIDLVNEAVSQILPALESELKRICLSSCHESSIEAISSYLESNLSAVYPLLNNVNLHRVLLSIWEQLMAAIETEARQNKEKDVGYFLSLSTLLHNVADIIHGDGKGLEKALLRTPKLIELDKWLHLYSCRVDKLIALYFNRRFQIQQDVTSTGCGLLSVKACFIENVLRVEILNARDLHVADIDACNPYVKIQLHPEKFPAGTSRLKTKVQSKTIYPLFDEVFEFSVDRERLFEKECCLVFTVKNHFTLKQSEILGESVLPVSEMATLTFQQSKSAQQRLLNIFRTKVPPELHDVLTALNDKSSSDARAADFVKTLNVRCRRDRRISIGGVTSALPRLAASLLTSSTVALPTT